MWWVVPLMLGIVGQQVSSDGAGPEIAVRTDLPDLVAAHNQARGEAGLPPLEVHDRLTAAAKVQAIDMARAGKMSHEGSDGSSPSQRVERQGYKYQRTAENVAEGYRTAESVLEAWMDSEHHRENILGDFTQIGLARAEGEDGRAYWAAVFGKPWPVLKPDQAAADLIKGINRVRQEAEKAPLRSNPRLAAVAQRHATDNAARDRIEREDKDGVAPLDRVARSGYRYLSLGQSDASGVATAEDVLKLWQENPQHRDNILGPFRDIGVGYATAESGKPYWTVIVGTARRN